MYIHTWRKRCFLIREISKQQRFHNLFGPTLVIFSPGTPIPLCMSYNHESDTIGRGKRMGMQISQSTKITLGVFGLWLHWLDVRKCSSEASVPEMLQEEL